MRPDWPPSTDPFNPSELDHYRRPMTDSSDTSHVVARAEGRAVAPGPSAEPDDLVSMIHAARSRVDALRAGTVDPTRLLAARGVLLGAIESYAGDLIRRGLPIPP